MDKWLAFYTPHFTSPDVAKKFVESCENHPDNIVKILMHQTQRLISLSDDIQEIRPGDEALQLLFLIMCVENISKLQAGYTDDGKSKSKYYVKKFFDDFLCEDDKDLLRNGFIDNNKKLLPPLTFEMTFDEVVDMLYEIRCDVVHEGNYTDFDFHNGIWGVVTEHRDKSVISKITLKDVRDVIIRGCIMAIQSK